MKIQKILLTAATVMLLTTGSAWAHNEGERRSHTAWHEHGNRFGHWFRHERGQWFKHGHGYGLVKVPEIDAASGTSAIALLTGILLLAGERSRSRRS